MWRDVGFSAADDADCAQDYLRFDEGVWKRLTGRMVEKAVFDQIPCGSNWACDENIAGLVRFCRKNIAPERLHGFLMTTWGGTLPSCEAKLARGIDLAAAALSCQSVARGTDPNGGGV